MKKFCVCVLALCFVASFAFAGGSNETKPAAGSQPAEQKIVLKIPETQPATHMQVRYFQKMADALKEQTKGRITGEIFPGAMMGSLAVTIQQMQIGALDMGRIDTPVLFDAGVDSMKIVSLPFIFRDVEHARKVLYGDVGAYFNDSIEKANIGLKGLGFWIEAERNFFLKNKRVTKLEDIKGLKMRIPGGKIFLEMITSFNASGTTMGLGELYSALQTGIVDGACNSFDAFYTGSYYEVCKYMAVSVHTLVMTPVCVSTVRWKSFSEPDRKIITDAFNAMLKEYDKENVEYQKKIKDQIRAKGVEINELTDRQKWIDAVQPMYKKYSPGYEDIIKKMTAN